MAELPTMPVRTDALLGDTTHLSATEFGAYMRLLIAMWRNGCWLPRDEKRLARYATLTAGQWARSRDVILEFFDEIEGGRVTQGRLADEWQAATGRSITATENANARWRRRTATRVAVEQRGGLPYNGAENGDENKPLETLKPDDAAALPPHSGRNAIQYPVSKEKRCVVAPVDASDLYRRILDAYGRNQNDVPSTAWFEHLVAPFIERWRAIPLTDDQIVTVCAANRQQFGDMPRNPSALNEHMRRYHSALTAAPPAIPEAPTEGGSYGRRPLARPSRSTASLNAALAGARRLPGEAP